MPFEAEAASIFGSVKAAVIAAGRKPEAKNATRLNSGKPTRRKNEAGPLEGTKRQVRELNPDWDAPERVASRERSRAAMRAEQRGHQLAQLRKNTGPPHAQVATMMGVSQARVSQIEHGKVTEVDAIRGYVEARGGTVDVVAQLGDWTVRVA